MNPLDGFDPALPERILNNEIVLGGQTFVIATFLGNGMDKVAYGLHERVGGSITHVLKIFRRKISEKRFRNWQALEAKGKEAALEWNEINDHRVNGYKLQVSFPASSYSIVNGWSIELQEYVDGLNLEQLTNGTHFFSLFEAIEHNDLARVLEEANRALEKRPFNPQLLHVKGHCLIKMNRPDEGIEYLERALASDPAIAGLYSALASAKFSKGEFSQAKLYARQAIGTQDPDIEAFVTLFNVEMATGNIMNAVRTFTALKEAELPRDRLSLMELQIKRGLEERKEIGAALEKALSVEGTPYSSEVLAAIRERFPNHIVPWFFSGTLALSTNNLTDAKMYFMRAYSLDSFDPENIFYLGYVSLISLSPNDARQYLGEWKDFVDRLFVSIQRKLQNSVNGGLEVTLEEGLFLASVENTKRNCQSALAYYHGKLNEEQKDHMRDLQPVMQEIERFYRGFEHFTVGESEL